MIKLTNLQKEREADPLGTSLCYRYLFVSAFLCAIYGWSYTHSETLGTCWFQDCC